MRANRLTWFVLAALVMGCSIGRPGASAVVTSQPTPIAATPLPEPGIVPANSDDPDDGAQSD